MAQSTGRVKTGSNPDIPKLTVQYVLVLVQYIVYLQYTCKTYIHTFDVQYINVQCINVQYNAGDNKHYTYTVYQYYVYKNLMYLFYEINVQLQKCTQI